MKEKELRLALVYYGGVSLAVYQHGVNIELLNLLRASAAYHKPPWFETKQAKDHHFPTLPELQETTSTEPIYFELLKCIGASLDLRIVADVISGSSAGAINGISLARAIAHDLDLEPVTDLWLKEADILRLLAPEAKARPWSKWYLRPILPAFIRRLGREGLLPRNPDAGIRQRVSIFIRSRWFKPPFDGTHFSGLMLDGLGAMERSGHPPSTLLPPGCQLDLYVAATDYHGTRRTIFLHDPVAIQENDHRQTLCFRAIRAPGGEVDSEMDLDHVPLLAFAGRASASYPGAFPPARMAEMDAAIAARPTLWPKRQGEPSKPSLAVGGDQAPPAPMILIDGSILNNKPVHAAISAVRTHQVFRDVDRRLVYIDPHPDREKATDRTKVPGFFATLRSALSDLPRHNPIYEELEEVGRYNGHIRRLNMMIQASRPQVDALLEQATEGKLNGAVNLDQLRHWRLTSNTLLTRTPIICNAWFRALVEESIDFITSLIAHACRYPATSQQIRWVREVIEAWCDETGLFPENYIIPLEVARDADLPSFARFIVEFGVNYKRRRMSFVLQDINKLYPKVLEPDFCATSPDHLDRLKRELHKRLNALSDYDRPDFLDDKLSESIRGVFGDIDLETFSPPSIFALARQGAITQTLGMLGAACALVDVNDDLDALMASSLVSEMGVRCRRIVLTGYLGFPFWDVVLLPTMSALEMECGTFEEILIDRISPADALTLDIEEGRGPLLGAGAIGFAGFLSRNAREHDYLWGRLNAIDRLLDIIASSVRAEKLDCIPDLDAFKRQAFAAVIKQESARLQCVPNLLDALRKSTGL